MRAFWEGASVELTLNATGIKQQNVSRPVPPTNLRRADVSPPVALAMGTSEGENAAGETAKEAYPPPHAGEDSVEDSVEGAGRPWLTRLLLQAPGVEAGEGVLLMCC